MIGMLSIIAGVDETFVTNTTAHIGELFTDLGLLIALVIGIPLGFYVIRKAISLVRTR
ncbi:unnamed protein product [marine sediment metagenome]|uniref:Uncharacterized protein n=1 Tax=marine sediment metagenome TaxID=412755 RepID=X1PRQ1_9ZZZZ